MSTVKKVGAALAIFLILALIAAGLGFWWLTQPMYEPGEVRARMDLEPPAQSLPPGDAGRWLMPDGVEIAWFAAGQGRPVLVVHGGPGVPPVEPWTLGELYAHHRFYFYAQRGSGASTRPFDRFEEASFWQVLETIESKLGIAAQLADIERIRRILGEERLLLVGHSFGGLLAALYAAEFPERVDRLVLLAPADALVLPAQEDFLERIASRLKEEDERRFRAFVEDLLDFGRLPDRTEAELVEQQRTMARYYWTASGGAPEGLERALEPTGGWVVPALYLGLGMRHDWRDHLRVVDRPALVVHGGRDLVPPRRSQVYVDALPQATLSVLEDAGHFPQLSHPEALSQLLRAFFDEPPE